MKRKNKTSLLKKIIKTLPVLLGSAALVYVGLLIKDVEIPTMLPVDDVAVIGELAFLDENEIRSMVKENIDGGYFTVDLSSLREKLMQQPWIKNVSLRRQWPANLDVIITEQVPVAYWNKDGYINDEGEVFRPESIDKKLNLPRLNGPEGHHDNVWKFMNVLYQEMSLLEFEVVRLDLDVRRSWKMVVSEYRESDDSAAVMNMIDVKLGRFETEKRLKRFVRILPSLTVGHDRVGHTLKNKNIKVIDMRYPNGFAVQVAEA
ncbi:MAG: cell division protein FtsQ/DivIB [Gammaproteobacteria bacterium]|nr:cell division protein FtsQ/DivIB [Gammaproteobacteria bacterium]